MGTSKHTPGPWVAIGTRVVRDVNTLDVLAALAEAKVRRLPPAVARAEAEANARLMAAAPDMFDVLRELLKVTAFTAAFVDLNDAARAAIAKAEGTLKCR